MSSQIHPHKTALYRVVVFIAAIASAVLFAILAGKNPHPEHELKAGDLLARLAPRPVRPDIVILGIDDADIKKYGSVEKWPRTVLADGISAVERGKPKLVVMDLALNKRTGSGDAELWRTIANDKNVVFGMAYNAARNQTYTPDDLRGLVFLEKFALASNLVISPNTDSFTYADFEPPLSDFTGSASGVGVFVRETDQDGVLRDARLFYNSSVVYPPQMANIRGKFPQPVLNDGAPVALTNLALITADRALDVEKDFIAVSAGDSVRIGGNFYKNVSAPVDDQGKMIIRFSGPEGTYQRVAFHDILKGSLPAQFFKDKIVIVGSVAANDPASEFRATPMPGLMSMPEITANTVATILDRSYVGRFERKLPGIILAIGLVTGLILMFFAGSRLTLMALLTLIVYAGIVYFTYAFGHTLMPIVAGFAIILITWMVGLILTYGPLKDVPHAHALSYEETTPEPNDVSHA